MVTNARSLPVGQRYILGWLRELEEKCGKKKKIFAKKALVSEVVVRWLIVTASENKMLVDLGRALVGNLPSPLEGSGGCTHIWLHEKIRWSNLQLTVSRLAARYLDASFKKIPTLSSQSPNASVVPPRQDWVPLFYTVSAVVPGVHESSFWVMWGRLVLQVSLRYLPFPCNISVNLLMYTISYRKLLMSVKPSLPTYRAPRYPIIIHLKQG